MFYVVDIHGTPLIARWFNDPDEAADYALTRGFAGFIVCSAGGERADD